MCNGAMCANSPIRIKTSTVINYIDFVPLRLPFTNSIVSASKTMHDNDDGDMVTVCYSLLNEFRLYIRRTMFGEVGRAVNRSIECNKHSSRVFSGGEMHSRFSSRLRVQCGHRNETQKNPYAVPREPTNGPNSVKWKKQQISQYVRLPHMEFYSVRKWKTM